MARITINQLITTVKSGLIACARESSNDRATAARLKECHGLSYG